MNCSWFNFDLKTDFKEQISIQSPNHITFHVSENSKSKAEAVFAHSPVGKFLGLGEVTTTFWQCSWHFRQNHSKVDSPVVSS